MDGAAATSKKVIQQSHSLCPGEKKYVQERKQEVVKALKSLGIHCTVDSVPHVALLGTGGGERADVALMGSLYQLQKEGLLGTLLYLAGVSGSTWCMSVLYSDPQWSSNMDAAVSRLVGPGVSLTQILTWLYERSKEEDFCLTDVWGVLISAAFMKRMDLRHPSDEASSDTGNPYPIYCAIERDSTSDGSKEEKWFEVSPHQAGFTELGYFVETSLLGSKFQGGDLLEKKPEMDFVKFLGILSSALAKGFRGSNTWLNAAGRTDRAAAEYLYVYNTLLELVALIRCIINSPTALSDLDKLENSLKDKVIQSETEWLTLWTEEGRQSSCQRWIQELLAEVENWITSLVDGDLKHLTMKFHRLIPKWEWGTTANFLYKYQDETIPPYLQSKDKIHLIDAGLMINAAYPSFLGDKRDINLIIAPEFSAGDMFETLFLARDYATKVKKPFPKIDKSILEDKDWPKDCYVFKGNGKEPTIVYMPLFNRRNCKDKEEFKKKMDEYATLQFPYNEEKIKRLLEIAKDNVKNNKKILLREMQKAVHQ